MSREQKLALVLGFAIVLIVGVLVSDHLSDAGMAHVEKITAQPSAPAFGRGDAVEPISPRLLDGATLAQANQETSAFERITTGMHKAVNGRVYAFRNQPPPAAFETRTIPVFEMGGTPDVASAHPKPGRTYTIKPSDSLWVIAQREYGEPQLHRALANYNTISGDLHIGDTIILPTIDMLTGAPAPIRTVPPTPPKPDTTAKSRQYTIQAKDTLSEIAQRELGTIKRMDEILTLNPSLDKNNVRVGAKILLPAR